MMNQNVWHVLSRLLRVERHQVEDVITSERSARQSLVMSRRRIFKSAGALVGSTTFSFAPLPTLKSIVPPWLNRIKMYRVFGPAGEPWGWTWGGNVHADVLYSDLVEHRATAWLVKK